MATPDFSKSPKLTLTDHFFIIGFILGVAYLLSGWNPTNLIATFSWIIFVYALFWIGLEFRNTKGKIYQSAIAHFPKENRGKVTVTKQPQIAKTYRKTIDFKGYITNRNNRNLFVAGRSGSGKSTLMRYLINIFPNSAKTIFSFKAGDEYLKLGLPILSISEYAGDPFSDKEAFVQSFLATYPMNAQGVVAASVPNLLRTSVKESSSWKELRATIEKAMEDEKPGNVTHSAYNFIHQKLTDLELKNQPYIIDLNKDIVLDFSGLNESAKTFYAELYLRQAWHSIEASQPDPMRHIIIIDEAHRLLKSEATIFGEVARLIRSRGALWCGTQNYSDLPDYVRNQFAMHLLFSTKSDRDLKALKEINVLLPFLATELDDHYFTDAATREIHDAIPIYTADIRKFKDIEESYIKPEHLESAEIDAKPKEMPDYRERVLKMLTEEASWPSKLAKDIAKQEGIGEYEPKLAVSKALKTLQNDGLVARQMMKLEDKEVMLYYIKDPSISGLHKFMEREITKKLEEEGIVYELAKPGKDMPDIITKNFDVEIETGLKKDLNQLAKRLSIKQNNTYVIVPNISEKERYAEVINASNLTIMQLSETKAAKFADQVK